MRNEYIKLVEKVNLERLLESGNTVYPYEKVFSSDDGLIFTFKTNINDFAVGLGSFEGNASVFSPESIISVDFVRYDSEDISWEGIEDFEQYEQFQQDFGWGDDEDDQKGKKDNFVAIVSTVADIVEKNIIIPRKKEYPDQPLTFYFKGLPNYDENGKKDNARERIYFKFITRKFSKLGEITINNSKSGFLVKLS